APPDRQAGFCDAAWPAGRRRRGRCPGSRSRESSLRYLRSESELAIVVGVCIALRCIAHAFGSLFRSPTAPSRPDAPTSGFTEIVPALTDVQAFCEHPE